MSNGVANIIKQTGNYNILYIACGLFIATSILFWIFVHEPESSDTKQTIPSGGHWKVPENNSETWNNSQNLKF